MKINEYIWIQQMSSSSSYSVQIPRSLSLLLTFGFFDSHMTSHTNFFLVAVFFASSFVLTALRAVCRPLCVHHHRWMDVLSRLSRRRRRCFGIFTTGWRVLSSYGFWMDLKTIWMLFRGCSLERKSKWVREYLCLFLFDVTFILYTGSNE